MKIATVSVVGLILAAGCSNPKPQQIHRQPQIDSSQPPYIYVSGEVRMGGKFAWTNGMTLRDAITAAHGFSDFARRNLRVNHSDGSVDLYKLNSKMVLTNNPPVFPGDVVYSPRSIF